MKRVLFLSLIAVSGVQIYAALPKPVSSSQKIYQAADQKCMSACQARNAASLARGSNAVENCSFSCRFQNS